MRSRMIAFSSLSNASCALLAVLGVRARRRRVARVLLEHRLLDGLRGVLARELVLDRGRLVERGAVRALDLVEQVLVDLRGLDLELRPCRPSRAARAAAATSFLISPCAMSSASRISASGISLAPASTIRMASSVPETTRSSSDSSSSVLLGRVDDEVAVDLADPHRADGLGNGMSEIISAAEAPFIARMSYGCDVVDRQRHRHELGLAAPALGEQRAQRAVDHAGDQRALLAGAALALEERAGDLARGVHALLDIHRQREEVDVAEVARGRGGRGPRVSPWRTTTAPEACLASLPVSNEISVPPISTETRVTSDICSFLRPPSLAGPLHLLTLR